MAQERSQVKAIAATYLDFIYFHFQQIAIVIQKS